MTMMRKLATLTLTAGLLVPGLPGTASAAVSPTGFVCGYSSVHDPRSDGDTQIGEVDGGPLKLVDDDPAGNPVYGSVTCSIHVGWTNTTHAGVDAAAATSATTPGVVYLPPTVVTYELPDLDLAVLCTQVDIVGGPTLYRDGDTGEWTTDPNAYCDFPYYDPEPYPDPLTVLIDSVVCQAFAAIGATVPDVPGVLEIRDEDPAQGPDLYTAGVFIWDCPPYSW